MMKVLIYLKTFLPVFLTPFFCLFNISLSFAQDVAEEHLLAASCDRPPNEASVILPEEQALAETSMGKFIKDSRNGETLYRIKTIVIDAGHGGHDPGCLGSSSREKHLALAVSKKLAQAIRQKFPEVRVIMTRETDVFVPLYERAAIANRSSADLFISIHCNFMPRSAGTKGTETYVMGLHTAEHNFEVAKRENSAILLEDNYEKNYDYDPNSPEGHIMLSMFQNAFLEQSILFAGKVEEKFENNASRRSRGVKQAGFVVLKETAMPSVLVETGFLSNSQEERFLKTARGQETIAYAIASAFAEYKVAVESGSIEMLATNNPAGGSIRPVREQNRSISAPQKSAVTTNNSWESRPPSTTPERVYAEPRIIPLHQGPSTFQSSEREVSERSTYPAPHPNPPPLNNSRYEEIRFHVQLAASPNMLDTSQDRWKKVTYLVEIVMEDNMYKYQARNFSSLRQAAEAKTFLKARGFPDAFIVAYQNGRRISIEHAKKELGIE